MGGSRRSSLGRTVRFVPPLFAIGIAVAFFCAGTRWILEHRVGGILDLDEASYLSISVTEFLVLSEQGFWAWLNVIWSSIHAPLTTALASLVYASAGLELHYGFFVPLACATVTVLAVYALAAEIAGPSAGLSAMALTATTPFIVTYSRTFQFSMSATAVLTLALLAAVKSDRFSKIGWSIAFGICLGLVPLARTMTIAFLPGVLVGIALNVASSSDVLRRSILFSVALIVAMATAATWLAFSWDGVASYLIGYGYGARALEYGAAFPILSLDTLRRALRLITVAVFLPHFALIVAGLASALIGTFGTIFRHRFAAAREIANSPLLLLATTVFCGLAALVSSPNRGSAFVAPLLPVLITLAVCSVYTLSRGFLSRLVLTTVNLAVALVVALPFLEIYAVLPREKVTALPFIGPIAISNNRSNIAIYLEAGSPHPIGRDKAGAALWYDLYSRTNSAITQELGEGGRVAFGFRHSIYTPTALALVYLLKTHLGRSFILVDPGSGNTVEDYHNWLTTGMAAQAKMLLTASGTDGDFPPPVDAEAVMKAARGVGFNPIDEWPMPNGRQVTLWKRP